MSKSGSSWLPTTLGAACQVNPPKPKLAGQSDETPVLFVPMAAVDEVTGEVTAPENRNLGQVRTKSFRTFAPGDVLFAKITPCMENGKSAVVSNDATDLGFGSTEFHVLRPNAGVNPHFIWHFVRQKSFRRTAEEHMTGSVGQLRVPADFLKNFPIQLPSEAVQNDIVHILDSSIHAAQRVTGNLAGVRRVIERFRQAVLAAACSGDLTADWRASHIGHASIKTLLEDIDSVRKNQYQPMDPKWEFEIPDSWELVSLDRLTMLVTSGSRGWAKYYAENGPLFIRAQNINHDRLDLTDMAHVRPPKGAEGERTRIKFGDLLVTITGANVTKTAFVDRELDDAYINQHVALARPVLTELTPYLHLWITSPAHGRSKLSADAYGAGKPGLNLNNVRTTPIGLPPIEEQHEIMRRVHALLTNADRISGRAELASRSVEYFTETLLAKAFRGELVATESVNA